MPPDDTIEQKRAPIWVVVKGIALTATGFLTSGGMTFVCLMGRYLDPAWDKLGFVQEMPETLYAALFAAMMAWLFFALRFALRNRTLLRLSLSAAAFIVFAIRAENVLKMAYPVCNPF